MGSVRNHRPQVVFFFVLSSVLTHALGHVQVARAAGTTSSETTSSSQPLWSYQVKPNSYVNVPASQPSHYQGVPSIFDAFNGLSQRQGALSSSPFLSFLPIILIAAGGMLLLLPFLTMMIASPFSGGLGGGGFNGGFGYPQVGALNKKRSLGEQFGQRGLIDLIEHVSSSIEELTKKYSPQPSGINKRAKSLNSPSAANESQPANHKPITSTTNEETANGNSLSNSSGST